MTTQDEKREWVRKYAQQGYAPIPVGTDKHPAVKAWNEKASSDPEKAETLFNSAPRAAGLGIVCGAVSGGLLVVDLDVKNSKDGLGNWYAFLEENGISLPETYVVRTRSGGEHHYFRMPDGVLAPNRKNWKPGIDLQGEGAFVVAPPTPGYEIIRDVGIALIPPSLVDLLPKKPGRERSEWVPRANASDPQAGWLALGKAAEELRHTAPGDRGNTLFYNTRKLTDFIAAGVLPKGAVEVEMSCAAMDAGLDLDDIDKQIASALSVVREEDTVQVTSGTVANATGTKVYGTKEWLYDALPRLPVIWGTEEQPLWASGQSMMLFGFPSTGKSTLAQGLIAGRLGVVDNVLGFPVKRSEGGVLYVALDRPTQIGRSLVRFFPEDCEALQKLSILLDLGKHSLLTPEGRDWLIDYAKKVNADTIVIDSLKRALPEPSKEGPAGAWADTRQELLNAGIEVVEIHHSRKANGDRKRPTQVSDVYGAGILSEAAGSILNLWKHDKDPDDVFELSQVKPLTQPLRPRLIKLDRETGIFTNDFDLNLSVEQHVERILQAAGAPLDRRAILARLAEAGVSTTDNYLRNKLPKWAADAQNDIATTGHGFYIYRDDFLYSEDGAEFPPPT